MHETKLTSILRSLHMSTLRKVSDARGLDRRREKKNELVSRLGKSFKGDYSAFLSLVDRSTLIDLFEMPVCVNGKYIELRNKSAHKLERLREMAFEIFVEGLIPQECDLLEEGSITNLKDLSSLIAKNNKVLCKVDLSNRDLRAFDFSDVKLFEVDFTNSLLENANFKGATFIDTNLDSGEGWKSRIGNKDGFIGATFYGPDGIAFSANLSGLNLSKTFFFGELSKLNLSNSILDEAQFKNSDFFEFDFSNASLIDAKFTGNNCFYDCKFDGAKIRCDISNSLFEGGELVDSDFSLCDVSQSTFDVSIVRCNFTEVDLQSTHFMGDIVDSKFNDADMENSMWDRIEISDCDFTGARLTRGNLEDVIGRNGGLWVMQGAEFVKSIEDELEESECEDEADVQDEEVTVESPESTAPTR